MRTTYYNVPSTLTVLAEYGIHSNTTVISPVSAPFHDLSEIDMSIKTSLLILSLLSSTLWVTVASANFSSEQSIQPQTMTLKLQNMTCALCPITIKKALQEVEGVQQVIVDFDTKTAAITFDSKKTNSDALIKATTNAGYPSAIAASNVR